MKTLEEFQSFYETELLTTLNALEVERKKAVKFVPLIVLGFVVIGLCGLGSHYFNNWNGDFLRFSY